MSFRLIGEKRMQKHSRHFIIATCLASMLALSGCETMNNQSMGNIIGGGVGALLGNQIGGGRGNVLAIVIGGVAGYVIGGKLGSKMDKADLALAA